MSFKGKTVFISGASRGIGLAIAKRLASEGANIAIAAKTTEAHPKLPGTIYSAAEEVIAAGGQALPLLCDIRDEESVKSAVAKTVETFGGIDICINNASAISLTNTLNTPIKRFDLMFGVNVRGTFLVSQTCAPHLIASARAGGKPKILNLSPPLNMKAHWFGPHTAYTMAKYGMSMCVLGMAEEFREHGIAVSGLWPRTIIATAALQVIPGADWKKGRTPEIMADAAAVVLAHPGLEHTGKILIDDEVLASAGVTDLSRYAVTPGTTDLMKDLFLD
jgi:citronellol/citronellal dehydrogenase